MRKLMLVLLTAVITLGFLMEPAVLHARGGRGGGGHGGHGGWGGRGGGFHGGSHGSYRGGSYGGVRYYGGTALGYGVGFGTAYYYDPWYYYPNPSVYAPPPVVVAPPPTYIEPAAVAPGPSSDTALPPGTISQVSPNSNQRRCQKWAPTGQVHNESRWNTQTQIMETVSVPNFAWRDFPCN
jgi:hypothetical protein